MKTDGLIYITGETRNTYEPLKQTTTDKLVPDLGHICINAYIL